MGWLEGLLGGFSERKSEIEQQNLEEARQSNAREGKIYEALLNSPDPEIKAMAATGLLESAGPRKKKGGFSGWMGQFQGNPTYDRLRELVNTPVETTGQTTQPSGQITRPTNAQAPAGTPAHSLTEPGAPAATPPEPGVGQAAALPTSIGQPPPTASAIGSAPRTYAMRQLFEDPNVAAYNARVSTGQADIDVDLAREKAGLAPKIGGTLKEGNIHQDAQGNWVQDLYNNTGQVVKSIPAAAPRTSAGAFQVLAGPTGKPTVYRIAPDGSKTLIGEKPAAAGAGPMNERQALTLARTMLPNASVDEMLTLGDALMNAAPAGTPAAAGGAAPGGGTAPGAAPATAGGPPTVVGAPPPGTPTAAPATPTPAATPAAPTAPPAKPAGGPGSRVRDALPEGFGARSVETGKPISPSVSLALARSKSANTLIDQALTALEPFKNQNTADDTINMVRAYRQGTYEPLTAVASQLSDLAGLQQSASQQLTSGGSRAIRTYVDRRQHVPRLPSGRQIQAADMGLSGGTVNWLSQWRGDEGGFDTPQMMYGKLQAAKALNTNFIDEIDNEFPAATGISKQGVGQPPPGRPGASQAVKDASGNWQIRY